MDFCLNNNSYTTACLCCGCQTQTEIKIIIILVDWFSSLLHAMPSLQNMSQFSHIFLFLFLGNSQLGVGVSLNWYRLRWSAVCSHSITTIKRPCILLGSTFRRSEPAECVWREKVSYLFSAIAGGIPYDSHSFRTDWPERRKKSRKFKVWYFDDALVSYCEIMREIRNLSNHSNLKRKHGAGRISLARTPHIDAGTLESRKKNKRNLIHLARCRRRPSDLTKFKWLKSRDIYIFISPVAPANGTQTKIDSSKRNEDTVWHLTYF